MHEDIGPYSASVARAALSQVRPLTARRPAAAYRVPRLRVGEQRTRAAPRATASPGGTAMPSMPGRMTERTQATGVDTTGRPTAIASATAIAGGEVV